MKNYCKGLFQISQNYAQQLMAEMNVQPGTTAIIQVELGLPPKLNVGFEKSFGGGAAVGTLASRS